MYIAGMYPFPFYIGHGHDSSFSIFSRDDIYSCEEGKIAEMVMNQYPRIPERSMLAGFRQLGIKPSDIDIWAFGQPNNTPVEPSLKFLFSEFKIGDYHKLKDQNRIRFVDHHFAHAALSVYGCGFRKGAFLTLDGGGDESQNVESIWGTFEGNTLSQTGHSNTNFGLTSFHNFVCESIGFLSHVDNGKAMGLASYAEIDRTLFNQMSKFLRLSDDGLSCICTLRRPRRSPMRLHKLKVNEYQRYKVIHSPCPPAELGNITRKYPSPVVAATGQAVFEEFGLKIVRRLLETTGETSIALSGGTFQNVAFNRRLLELGLDNIYVSLAPNDAGLSLGAAVSVYLENNDERPKHLISPFLGLHFSNEEIEKLLSNANLRYKKVTDICKETAALLDDGNVVGWFQGRNELGPRALGARTVLADPRHMKNKARINQFLKRRDWFMPYAPSCTIEDVSSVFKNGIETPYMNFAFKVAEEGSSLFPAAAHVDGTSRPSTISEEQNPKYYRLISEFKKLTGVPVVLNTSFNRHGIATIVTPRQAIQHLMDGCMDVLAIEDYLVWPRKNEVSPQINFRKEKDFLIVEALKPIAQCLFVDEKQANSAVSFCNEFQERNVSISYEKKTITLDGETLFLNAEDLTNIDEVLLNFIDSHV